MDRCPEILEARSLTEAQLFLWVKRCGQCGSGPLAPGIGAIRAADAVLVLPATCRACRVASDLHFAAGLAAPGAQEVRLLTLDQCDMPPGLPIDPTEKPSRLIDVAGWLTLDTLLSEKARQVAGRAENAAGRAPVRQWQLLAGACIEEAMKFFEKGNELPPAKAFFDDASRRQFRERPELFTRERLIHLKSRKPMPVVRNRPRREAREREE